MVTLKEIAKICGVSTTAVSVVLNDRPNRISKSIRTKILKTAEELNYRPNQLAASLSKGQTKVIGLIIPDLRNNYFSSMVASIHDFISPLEFKIMLGNTNDDPLKDISFSESFLSYNVDGLMIVISSNHTKKTSKRLNETLINTNKPIIFLDRESTSKNFHSFISDHKLGGYFATKHLLSLGHRKIGCLTGSMKLQSARERYQGYLEALKEYQIPEDKSLSFEGDYHLESGIASLPYFLKISVTAIFSSNDMMAFGLYNSAQSMNVKIPEDLSIIGFDNNILCKFAYPTLSSISQPLDKIVKSSCQYLLNKINKLPTHENGNIFSPKLIVRNSCFPPKKLE